MEMGRALIDAGPEALGRRAEEERLPFAHAAALIVTMSLGVWAVIAVGVRLLLG